MKIKLNKLKQDYKPSTQLNAINDREVSSYLKEFYGSDLATYEKNTDASDKSHKAVRNQINKLCDKMKTLGVENFASLNSKFSSYYPPLHDEAQRLNKIKENMEAIFYLVNKNIENIENFKTKYKDRQFNCNDGTLTNLQTILADMILEQQDISVYIMEQKNLMIEQMLMDMYRKGEIEEFNTREKRRSAYEIHDIPSIKNLVAAEYNLPVKTKAEDRYLRILSQSTKEKILSKLSIELQKPQVIESMIEGIAMSVMANLPQLKESLENEAEYTMELQDKLSKLNLSLKDEHIGPNILCHIKDGKCIAPKANSDQIMQDIVKLDLYNRGVIEDPEIEKVKLRVRLENSMDASSLNNGVYNDLLKEAENKGLKEYALQYMIDNDLKLDQDELEDGKSSIAVEYCQDNKIKIRNQDPIVYAVENGKKIDGKDPVLYALDKGKKIDGRDPIVYAAIYNIRINGNDAVFYCLVNKIQINNQDPIKYAVDNGKKIDGRDPIVYAVHYGKKINGKDPIVYAVDNDKKIDGKDPIKYAVDNSQKINGIDPIVYAVDNGKKINGKDPVIYAADSGKKDRVEIILFNVAYYNMEKKEKNKIFDYIKDLKTFKKSFKAYKNLMPLLSKEEIDDKDIDTLKENFGKLTKEGQTEYINNVKSELLKYVTNEMLDNKAMEQNNNFIKLKSALASQIYNENEKSQLLQTACIKGDPYAIKLLLEYKADYTKLDYSKISDDVKKFLKNYGVKIQTETIKETEIKSAILAINIEHLGEKKSDNGKKLRELFNNIDPNKYKNEINEVLKKENNEDKRKELIIFLCKKGFDPNNFINEENRNFAQAIEGVKFEFINKDSINKTIKIIDEVISKTSASDKVKSERIYQKMQEAGLIDKKITEEKKQKIITKINKVTAEYNHENRSHNFLKRAVRSLLHFVGVKYVGKKEAVAVLSKINLPLSKDKAGSIGR